MVDNLHDKNKDELKENILYWLCAAFIYTMLFWTYGNTLLAIVISAYWLFFLKKEFNLESRKSKMVLLFCSLYLIGLIGLLYTSNMTKASAILQKQSALLFFPLVFGTTSVLSSVFVKKIMNHFIAATVLACVAGLSIGLYNFVYTNEIETITGRGLLAFHAFNPIIMGMYCLVALVFMFTYNNTNLKFKKWLPAFSIILSVFIFLLSIRIIIFCWVLLVLFFLWKKTKTYRLFLFLGLLLSIFISGLMITPLKNQWKELVDFSGKNTITLNKDSSLGRSWGGKALRIAIWKCSSDIIKNNWLIGVGTGDTQDNLQQSYENRKFYFASRYNQYNAHNQYLQFTIAFGIIGLLLFILCMTIPLYHYKLKYANNTYVLFIVIFATVSLIESVLEVNKGIILYSFFNSIFAFTDFNNATNNK